ncbi:hypothetical protein C1645_830489 [Glomus cerebriforme]|uniref:DDE-1 domain-containing protein n=1 Tax=Glomus cerebriforme TaxID=658196 RepID=A0A397SNW1_9GLOM|nr:hypothetical protein C1645_830489 [Glomus cerebriforme]
MRRQDRNILLLIDNAPTHALFKAFDKYNEYGIDPVDINIKKCIKYVARAWDSVTQSTIKNCWLKADILLKNDESEANTMDFDIIDADMQIYSTQTKELGEVQVLINRLNFEVTIDSEEFIYYDNDEITIEIPSNEEILKVILPNNQEKETEEPFDPLPSVTHNKVIEYYEKVILYLEQQENYFGMKQNELKFIKKLKKEALKQQFISAKQTNLDSFINGK